MNKCYAIFEQFTYSLSHPIAIFDNEKEANVHASHLSFLTGKTYMVSEYDLHSKAFEVAPAKLTLYGSMEVTETAIIGFKVDNCHPYKEGSDDRVLYINKNSVIEEDGYKVYLWDAIEEIDNENDTFETVKERVFERFKTYLGLKDERDCKNL